MNVLQKKDLSKIGFVNKTYGFNGKVSCIIESATPGGILKNKFLFILLEGLPVPFEIEEAEENGSELLVKFYDVSSQEEAKKLLRNELYIMRNLSRKKKKEVSWNDLEGFMAIDETHGELGKITAISEYPMQLIAHCLVKGKEVLFPLHEEIVSEIDEKNQIIYISLPEGLIDVYLGK